LLLFHDSGGIIANLSLTIAAIRCGGLQGQPSKLSPRTDFRLRGLFCVWT
jgi:hypothetical protein